MESQTTEKDALAIDSEINNLTNNFLEKLLFYEIPNEFDRVFNIGGAGNRHPLSDVEIMILGEQGKKDTIQRKKRQIMEEEKEKQAEEKFKAYQKQLGQIAGTPDKFLFCLTNGYFGDAYQIFEQNWHDTENFNFQKMVEDQLAGAAAMLNNNQSDLVQRLEKCPDGPARYDILKEAIPICYAVLEYTYSSTETEEYRVPSMDKTLLEPKKIHKTIPGREYYMRTVYRCIQSMKSQIIESRREYFENPCFVMVDLLKNCALNRKYVTPLDIKNEKETIDLLRKLNPSALTEPKFYTGLVQCDRDQLLSFWEQIKGSWAVRKAKK